MKIASIDKDVKDVLGSSYYRIPRFQRPYSWERENISDFWADTVQDSDADYFIGSMVVFKANSDTYGIVDGQQRLTTITMILCALRNALQKEGFTDLASGTHQLIERKDIDNNARYILSTESSFPYFQEHVQKFGIAEITAQVKDEEKNIQIVYSQIKNYIDSAVSSVKSNTTLNATAKRKRLREELISIRDKILGLKLIFVELDNDDDAYVIFETLNTRGKDLNAADLVKSLLTRLVKASGVVDTTKIKWERIVATIEGSSQDLHTEVFLHHYWLSKYDYVTLKKLYKRIRKTIDKSKAKGFLNELGTDAITYREIHETSFRSWRGD